MKLPLPPILGPTDRENEGKINKIPGLETQAKKSIEISTTEGSSLSTSIKLAFN